MENKFKESLEDKNHMTVTWELVPGRGAREKAQESALANAEKAANSDKIHALTITDNPGGTPALASDQLGKEIMKLGIEPMVHFTCKDRNRNQIESQLYAMDRENVRNLLVMTGDYVLEGYEGRPKPTFDLDSVNTLRIINEMNDGLEYKNIKGQTVKHQESDFYPGAVVSPFKSTEAELMGQYYKLKKKVEAGAKYIITQLGYDARKYHEVIQFMKQNDINLPVIGNLYVLPYGAAKIMNKNQLPGCVVTEDLLNEIAEERQASDKGKQARLLRAAKMYAFMKGMGYDGVHIGGLFVKCEDVEYIVDKGEELSQDWEKLVQEFDFPQPNGFYYFEKDENTGLNTDKVASRQNRPLDASIPLTYKVSRVFHKLMFEPNKGLFGLMRGISKAVDGSSLEKPYHSLEHISKVLLYDCKDCGDCMLMDIGYICPMSQCPKNQRNGPCGGSFNGWCEVYPNERKCVYVQAYSRLKKHGEEDELDKGITPPCNWDLYQTSSWINYYLGRDHHAETLGITDPKKENEE